MTKGFRKASSASADDTSLQGYVTVPYSKLVRVFGKAGRGDREKVDAEWVLKFDDGTVATIYNYKDGKAYLGKNGKSVSQITAWHIGGKSVKAVRLVKAALR